MKHSRIARTVFAVIFLILFGIFLYLYYPLHTKSKDIEDWGEPTVSVWQLLRRGHVIIEYPDDAGNDDAEVPEVPAEEQPAEQPAEEPQPAAEATPEPVDPNSPAGRAATLGLPTPPAIDISGWQFTLVNADHPLDPIDYVPPEIVYLNMTADDSQMPTAYDGNRLPVDSRIAEALISMARGCKDAGLPVYLSSGYRSYSDQVANFQRVCQNNGITDGKDSEGHYITMPAGCSEHQLAMCCDITDVYRPVKNAEIENTDTYKWLKEHCTEYGFILRFPESKKDTTGVMYEPFHFRYVGVEAAEYITANDLCLEDFVTLYK